MKLTNSHVGGGHEGRRRGDEEGEEEEVAHHLCKLGVLDDGCVVWEETRRHVEVESKGKQGKDPTNLALKRQRR